MKKLYKIICVITAVIIMSACCVYAREACNLTVNGTPSESAAYCEEDGTVYVPVRTVAEANGYSVLWNEERQTVTTSNKSMIFVIRLGSVLCCQDWTKTIVLDAQPKIINDMTMISVNTAEKFFNVSCECDTYSHEVIVTAKQEG